MDRQDEIFHYIRNQIIKEENCEMNLLRKKRRKSSDFPNKKKEVSYGTF